MDFMKEIAQKGTLLVAHRGVAGANIPCNSLQAFAIAVRQGADIVELDVEKSLDGKLFIQHPGMEKVHLRMWDSIKKMHSDVVKELYLSNCDLVPTDQHIVPFEEALKALRGKAIVNIDKFWENPDQIAHIVRELDMVDQVLIKTDEKKDRLQDVIKYAPDLPYLAVIKDEDENYEERLAKLPRWVGVEVLFKEEDAPVASKAYSDRLHADGKFTYVNALVYNYRAVLAAGHNDDISILGEEERGWGWLADRFDVIQTDFLLPCKQFLEATGRRK